MELVKRIKTAESDAARLIADAREDVASEIEKANVQHGLKLSEKELERREIIDAARTKAELDAARQAEQMRTDAEKTCEEISRTVAAKLESAADQVIEYIMAIPAAQG